MRYTNYDMYIGFAHWFWSSKCNYGFHDRELYITHSESFVAKGYEIVYLTSPSDELCVTVAWLR